MDAPADKAPMEVTRQRRVVQVEVDRSHAELAADALWQAGPSAVSEEDRGSGRVRLTADVVVGEPLGSLPAGSTLVVLEIDGDAYLDEWRTWATPVRAGRRVVVHPAWLPVVTSSPSGITILIDPGRAFGSGAHPSTRLVIAAMEDIVRPEHRVLDVGAGSGVLAVAACLLGAAEVVAIDIDPLAVTATEANARVNGVASRVSVSTTPLDEVGGRYDVVVANIGAAVLRAMAPLLLSRLAPSGRLVLAGFLDDQAEEVVGAFGEAQETQRLSAEGWAASVLAPS